MDELMLDGNAVAGLLQEVFAVEMTTAVGTCARCGAAGPVGRVIRGSGSTPPESAPSRSPSKVASVLIEIGANGVVEPRVAERPRGSIAISVRGESRRDAQHAFEPGRHPPVPAAEERNQGRDEERADDGCVEQDAGG
jgi:Family of unknown function (DUF6510)